ncbi:hypothetical protein [Methylomarinum vadi]|uniref:hypothetical protein n=1 Tax=Methylomarinum vadi TaxID=438855 RepID=UPI0012691E2A|nr:hypothetical protein [Methylomarinum vadi]
MKRMLVIISLIVFPYAAHADWGWQHDRTFRVNHFWNKVAKRLDRQYFRIEKGIQMGDLTRWEAKKLKREHRRIDKRIARLRQQRWLSHGERRKIMAHLDKASGHIQKLKNNDRYARHFRGEHDHFRRDKGPVAWSSRQSWPRF